MKLYLAYAVLIAAAIGYFGWLIYMVGFSAVAIMVVALVSVVTVFGWAVTVVFQSRRK